jgi:hypothetical protein
MKAQEKLAPPSSSSSNEQKHETLSLKKTLIQPSNIQKTKEKGKIVVSSSKPEPHSTKMELFTSLEVKKKAYKTNFLRNTMLGKCEVSISDLFDTAFAFIKEIFRKK